jgi:hypothetical protein
MQWTRSIPGSGRFKGGLFAFGLLGLALVATPEARTILVFPISGEGVPAEDMTSVTRLFRDAIEGRSPGDSVSLLKSACDNRDCALTASRTANLDSSTDLVYSTFYKLGAKWIFSATVMKADGSNAFSQRLTARSIEDMEATTQRMADALVSRKTTEQVASIDNITEKEQDAEPERRRSLYKGGVAVGYLFPIGSSYQHNHVNEVGLVNPSTPYDQMIRLTWLNTWEFRNDLQLGTDLVWSIPGDIGADASLRYLFNRGDFSPFIGGGLGLHYEQADHYDDSNDDPHKRNSGPALNVQAGMMLFRTYDVNVMLRGQYQVIFNTDVDQGVAVDVGVSFGNKGGSNATGANSSEGISAWDYVGAGALLIFIIALAN